MNRVKHELEPIFDKNSKVLILGSMPSIKSRELNKYYANKQNRFWGVLESIYGEEVGDWKDFILRHHLALWDVIASCDIKGSLDATIKNVLINDIGWLIENSSIKYIYVLGKKAYRLYYKYIYPDLNIDAIYLPSTSSANARYNFNDLCSEFSIIKKVSN